MEFLNIQYSWDAFSKDIIWSHIKPVNILSDILRNTVNICICSETLQYDLWYCLISTYYTWDPLGLMQLYLQLCKNELHSVQHHSINSLQLTNIFSWEKWLWSQVLHPKFIPDKEKMLVSTPLQVIVYEEKFSNEILWLLDI